MAKAYGDFEHEYSNPTSSKFNQRAGETDRQYYKRLAKVANQRMVRLEDLERAAKAGEASSAFSNVTQHAYKTAQAKASKLRGGMIRSKVPGRGARFSESELTGLTDAQVQRRIDILKEFIDKPTSTKGDIIKIFKNRADTINKNFDTDFNWQQLAKFFESGLFDKLVNQFESDGAFEVIAAIQKSPKKIIKSINDADKLIDLVPDEFVREEVVSAIQDNGLLIQEFFK